MDSIRKIEPEDMISFGSEFNKELGKKLLEKKELEQRYIEQAPYKIGQKVMFLHRKHGWKHGRIENIRVNFLNGLYEYSIKSEGKIKPTGHILDILPI